MTPQPTIFAGEDLTYTLTVTNAGPGIAAQVKLEDATPLNTTFVSATAPAGWTITAPNQGGTGPITFEKSQVPLDIQAFLSVLRNVSTLRDVFADPPMFTIVVRVNPTAPVGTPIKNKATLTSPAIPTRIRRKRP